LGNIGGEKREWSRKTRARKWEKGIIKGFKGGARAQPTRPAIKGRLMEEGDQAQ